MSAFRQIGLAITTVVLLSILIGCGAGSEESVGGAEANQTAAASSMGKEAGGAASNSTAQARVIKDEIGHEVKIPAEPKRIIGIYLEDELISLGITPLRQSKIGAWSGQDYLGLTVPRIEVSGSVEGIVEADPDLILENVYDAARYEQFSKVAPMYSFKDARADWRATIRTLGGLLGKSDQAEDVIKQYDQRAKEAGAKIKQSIGDQTVAIVRVHGKEIRLYGGPGYAGPVVYQELGLTPSKLVRELILDKNEKVKPLSLEMIPQLDADHIFITVDTGAEARAQELLDNSLWKNLPAVKNGHVYSVNFETWMKSGPIADSKKIEDVVAALVK